jgi:Fe2+ or Zn2+ uptake regulation protein
MIDALFGSKTRVKLLHLFLNNPGKSFYVREITRLIDEQINSVRRELSNMVEVGIISIITSDSADNKLYYEVDQRYEHYVPLRAIFAAGEMKTAKPKDSISSWQKLIEELTDVRIAILAGVLVPGSVSDIDILLVGSAAPAKAKRALKTIEKSEGRELNYSLISYDEFYYRLSVRDKFITEILNGKHTVLVDTDNVLKSQK